MNSTNVNQKIKELEKMLEKVEGVEKIKALSQMREGVGYSSGSRQEASGKYVYLNKGSCLIKLKNRESAMENTLK